MPNYSKIDEKDFVFIPDIPSEQEKQEISNFIRKDKIQRKLQKVQLSAREKTRKL